MQVTVKFGTDTYQRTYDEGSTIGEILSDSQLKMVAGWGDNVRALVAGVEQPTHAIAPDGGMIVVETRANSKAARCIAAMKRFFGFSK